MGSVELNVGWFLNSPWKLHQKSFLSISLLFCPLITEVTYNKISKYLIFPFVWFHLKLEFNVNTCLECSLCMPTEQLERVRVDCPVSASVKWNVHFSVLCKKTSVFLWGFIPFTQRDSHPLKWKSGGGIGCFSGYFCEYMAAILCPKGFQLLLSCRV